MKHACFRIAATVVVLAGMSTSLRAQVPAIIDKARAYVGPEDGLKAVNSFHYIGKMVNVSAKDPTHPATAQIEIFVKRPDSLLITIASDTTVETDGLNDYEGWHRHEVKADPSAWKQVFLGPNSIRQMRANCWQNLSFYKPMDSDDPVIKDAGPDTADGIACEKVLFEHDGGIAYMRYFDKDTGRLVLTNAGASTSTGFLQGNELRQAGEYITFGLRLPKVLTTILKDDKGAVDHTVTITFESITINEPIPDSIFSAPPMLPRLTPKADAASH